MESTTVVNLQLFKDSNSGILKIVQETFKLILGTFFLLNMLIEVAIKDQEVLICIEERAPMIH